MTPRPSRSDTVKLTLHMNGKVVEVAKIEAVKQKVPVSVLIESAVREKLGLPKVGTEEPPIYDVDDTKQYMVGGRQKPMTKPGAYPEAEE